MATKDYPKHDHVFSVVVEDLPDEDPRNPNTRLEWSQCRICGESNSANPKPVQATKMVTKLTGSDKTDALIVTAKKRLAFLEGVEVSDEVS